MRNKTGIGWRDEARQPLMEGDEVLAPLVGRKVVAKVEHKRAIPIALHTQP